MKNFLKMSCIIGLLAAFLITGVFDADARRRRRNREVVDDTIADVMAQANRPWFQYYEAGLSYSAKKMWREAKEQFILAISVDPEPEVRKHIAGKRFIEYFPYLKAAESYYYINDIANAEKYLRISESKAVAPRDKIGRLMALIVEGRKKPVLYLFPTSERTYNAFVDIKGVAFDYHDITRVTIGKNEATLRAATIDEIKFLQVEDKLKFKPLDRVYFEYLGYPLTETGENVIKLRAYATNPDRASDLYELLVIRREKEKPTPKPTPVREAYEEEVVPE